MRFPFLSKSPAETTSSAAAWPWPACVNSPRTPSFRSSTNAIYKTMNSAFKITSAEPEPEAEAAGTLSDTSDSFFSIRGGDSFSSESAVVRGLRSDRLFFEPGETNSILEEAKSSVDFPFKDSAAPMAVDSTDPYLDFRASMEEMVEAHGLRDWDCLEELLAVYLRLNRKGNHGYIVGAFVDLLLHLAAANDDDDDEDKIENEIHNNINNNSAVDEQCSSSSTATQYSFTSPLSFSSSTCSSISPCSSGV